MCFHADKGIKGIGRVRWQAAFLASTQSSVPSPQSCVTARVVERKMFVVLILRLNRAMTAENKNSHNVSRMFPWQRKRLMMTHSYD